MLIQMELPEWVDIVKTARFKELPPYDADWYYIRAGESTCFFPFLFYYVYSRVQLIYWSYAEFDVLFNVVTASMARKIYLRQGIGIGGFQKIYGGRQRNGSRPPHFCKSSGAVSRNILQELQKMGIVDVDPKG
jgi:small subunit ribosomal protein S19e